jgi:hypothetical protein
MRSASVRCDELSNSLADRPVMFTLTRVYARERKERRSSRCGTGPSAPRALADVPDREPLAAAGEVGRGGEGEERH